MTDIEILKFETQCFLNANASVLINGMVECFIDTDDEFEVFMDCGKIISCIASLILEDKLSICDLDKRQWDKVLVIFLDIVVEKYDLLKEQKK